MSTIEFRIDLHTHTTCSDGAYTPKELLDKAKEAGLSGIAITDHDTLEAYSAETIQYAKELDLLLIVGVELSTFFENKSVHILGYGVSLDDPILNGLLHRLQQRRINRNRAILQKLARLAIVVTEQELMEKGALSSLGRPHIAQIMVNKGYVPSIEKAFKKYLGEGCPCYDSGEIISTEEAIDAIHHAGGKAFLAHPHIIKKQRFVRKLLQLPFDGLEGHYGSYHKEEDARWISLAKEYNLLISGGSDFHGYDAVHARLGSSWITTEDYETLIR